MNHWGQDIFSNPHTIDCTIQEIRHTFQVWCSEWELKTAISNVNFPSATGTVILTYITETDWACYRCRRSITGTIPLPFWSRSCRFARGTEARNTETTLKLEFIFVPNAVTSSSVPRQNTSIIHLGQHLQRQSEQTVCQKLMKLNLRQAVRLKR